VNPKQEALLRKAARSIISAEKQLRDGDADFAASRAYYAMFYAAEAALLGEGFVYKKHSAVIAGFAEVFTRTGKLPEHLHRYFMDAQNARLSGDYMSEMEVSTEEVQVHIDHAREFVTTITKTLHS
jgi:uncharacterized protein (UPF0332 family)